MASGSPTAKPFSFKPGSGSAPSSPLARSSPSAGGKRIHSISKELSKDSTPGLLPRHEESSHHRQLRSLLLDHRNLREMWEETETYDGLKAVRAWTQADEDVDRLQATIAPKQKGEAVEADSPVLLQQLSKARAHQLTSAFQDREQAGAALRKALATLEATSNRLVVLQDRCYTLLLETVTARGYEAVYRDGTWGTWNMEMFWNMISTLTSQYVVSTAHLRQSVGALSQREKASTGQSKLSARERSDLRQAARNRLNDAWALLPFLEKQGPQSERYFDDVCSVEVGRWDSEGQ